MRKILEIPLFTLFIIFCLFTMAKAANNGLKKCDKLTNQDYIYCAR